MEVIGTGIILVAGMAASLIYEAKKKAKRKKVKKNGQQV